MQWCYAARYVLKHCSGGLADKCEIQLAYAIGVAHSAFRYGRQLLVLGQSDEP